MITSEFTAQTILSGGGGRQWILLYNSVSRIWPRLAHTAASLETGGKWTTQTIHILRTNSKIVIVIDNK